MRFLACLFLLAASVFRVPGAAGSFVRAPVEDVDIPFWCDWGYGWDERCYREDTIRLTVGGVDDKVWRAALRFPLDGLPAGDDDFRRLEFSWDLTGLASGWSSRAAPNRGVLLRFAEEEEDSGVSGTYFPPSSFGRAALRPGLVVSCTVPTTGLSP